MKYHCIFYPYFTNFSLILILTPNIMIKRQSAARTCYYCKYGAIREIAGSCTKVSQPHAVESPLKRYSAPPNQTPPIEQASLTKAWLRKISTKKKKKVLRRRERGKRTSVTPNDNWPPFRPAHISFPSFPVPHSPTDKKKRKFNNQFS